MCDFDLERRKRDLGANPRTGVDERKGKGEDMENSLGGDRPRTAKYLLDWVVRLLIVLLTAIATVTLTNVRGLRSEFEAVEQLAQDLEVRVASIESNRFRNEDGLELWKALNERPTRDEISSDLSDIKEMIRAISARLD